MAKVINEVADVAEAVEDVIVQIDELKNAETIEDVIKEIKDVAMALKQSVKETQDLLEELKKTKKFWKKIFCCK
tara:strand:- start:27 stop:248 length:222 start_codon:yes stop_codon:yes gene_type:complete